MPISKFFKIIALSSLVLCLAACGNNRQNAGTKQNTTRSYGTNNVGNNINNGLNRAGQGITGTHLLGTHQNTRMEMSRYLADQIVSMKQVQSATVIVTDHSAYVAVRLKNNNQGTAFETTNKARNTGGSLGSLSNQSEVSTEIKQKIVDKVRSLSSSQLQNVYVSANPDFLQRMNSYAADVRQGKPLSGLVQQFNIMVERIFPTSAGTNPTSGR